MIKNHQVSRLTTLCVLPWLMITSCGQSSADHRALEAMDQKNLPGAFGFETLTGDLLTSSNWQRGALAQRPWTDSYWPLFQMGLGHRWINMDQIEDPEFGANPMLNNAALYAEDAIKDLQTIMSEWSSDLQPELPTLTPYLSPAEKYDLAFRSGLNPKLYVNELINFARNRRVFESKLIPWSWMGHCHGWAPASIMIETPRSAVLMKNEEGREVLFTEGDIRALITKTAADNSFSSPAKFVGTRCEVSDSDLIRDSLGRIVDGALGVWDQAANKFSVSVNTDIITNNWLGYQEMPDHKGIDLIMTLHHSQQKEQYWLQGVKYQEGSEREGMLQVRVYSTRQLADGQVVKDQLLNDENPEIVGCLINEDHSCKALPNPDEVERAKLAWEKIWSVPSPFTKATDIPTSSSLMSFRFSKGCRDLNAGTFHTLLARSLSDGATMQENRAAESFVLEISQGSEVWNHPLYSYNSRVGQKTPLAITEGDVQVEDPFRRYRAPGTTHIVEVHSLVLYGVENGPKVAYMYEDETLYGEIYRYTLELNGQDQVIGGEWHGRQVFGGNMEELQKFHQIQPKSGIELLRDLAQTSTDMPYYSDPVSGAPVLLHASIGPDFVWTFPKDATLKSSALLASERTMELHACSLSNTAAVEDRKLLVDYCDESGCGTKEITIQAKVCTTVTAADAPQDLADPSLVTTLSPLHHSGIDLKLPKVMGCRQVKPAP